MNFFKDVLGQLSAWIELPRQWMQAYPFLQTGLDNLCITLALATLLSFAGLGFMSATARILSITRKRSSYDKCAKQLAMLAMILGWILLVAGRVWLFFVQGSYTPDSLPDFMVELSWILLGLAVLISSLYFALWKFLVKVPILHVVMGIISSIQGCIAVIVVLGSARMLSAYGRPDATSITLGDIFFPGWLSAFWCSLYSTVPLIVGMSAGCAAIWLTLRRQRDDFGRDHYNTMVPWCAEWARNAWTIFWLIFLASTVAEIQQAWQGGVFTTENALRESIKVLVWIVPIILWTIVARSTTPMRHKLTLILALLVAMGFMLPYYSQVTNLSALSSSPAQEIIIEPLPQAAPQPSPDANQQAEPRATPDAGQQAAPKATPDAGQQAAPQVSPQGRSK